MDDKGEKAELESALDQASVVSGLQVVPKHCWTERNKKTLWMKCNCKWLSTETYFSPSGVHPARVKYSADGNIIPKGCRNSSNWISTNSPLSPSWKVTIFRSDLAFGVPALGNLCCLFFYIYLQTILEKIKLWRYKPVFFQAPVAVKARKLNYSYIRFIYFFYQDAENIVFAE